MKKLKNVFIIIFIISALFAAPHIEARGIKDFFRGIGHAIKFVVNLPDKATRFLGPVIGPIAADLLTQNIIGNPRIGGIFRHARNIDKTMTNVEDQKKILGNVQKNFRDQATDLKNQAYEIRSLKNQLEQDLLSRSITYNEYEDKVMAIDRMADAYDRAADKFNESADRIKPDNLVSMVGRNVFNQMLRQIRDAVKFELKSEINRFINPDIIESLVSRGNLNFDQIIDILISGDVSRIAGENKDIDIDEFRKRLRNEIKDILKNNKDALKNNWRSEIDKVINKIKSDLEKEKEKLPDKNSVITPAEETKDKSEKDTGTSDTRCPPGYEFCPQCGVDCRQKNCASITYGHWSYTGQCICGSAGSINENPNDPNRGCYYDQNNKSCPGCLYKCIHYNEKCPKPPK